MTFELVGVTAAISIPLLIVAFNVSKFERVWKRFTHWDPIRRNFCPETEDKFPFMCRAEEELRELGNFLNDRYDGDRAAAAPTGYDIPRRRSYLLPRRRPTFFFK